MSECTKLERDYLDLVKSGCTDHRKILTALHAIELAMVSDEWKEKTIQARVRTLVADNEFQAQWDICPVKGGGGDFSAFSTLWQEIEKKAKERITKPLEMGPPSTVLPSSYWYGTDK